MRFLVDEDVPRQLLTALIRAGHDAVRVEPATPDSVIATRAHQEGRVLITLDKDFTNTALYPPASTTIIHLHIHPPYAADLIGALMGLLDQLPPKKLKGLIVLGRSGSIHFTD